MRLPGELIELAPSRAVALRGCGLIGGEYIESKKDDVQSSEENNSSDDQSNAELTNDEPEKTDGKPGKTESIKLTESRKRVK
jgi:hypothetical protein